MRAASDAHPELDASMRRLQFLTCNKRKKYRSKLRSMSKWKSKTEYARNKTAKLYDQILQGTPCKKAGYSEPKTISEYAPHLRGPTQNKYGGHKSQQVRGLRGNTYGAASPWRTLTPEEKAEVEADLRANGRLPTEETEPEE